jgi:hypothetical protein
LDNTLTATHGSVAKQITLVGNRTKSFANEVKIGSRSERKLRKTKDWLVRAEEGLASVAQTE